MNSKLYTLISILIAVCFHSCKEASEQGQIKKPNVLLIITDDQGYGDLSIHGNTSISTPFMDQLGHDGIRLDRFMVSPVCSPTRASLLTGRYHYRTGTLGVTRNKEAMRTEEATLGELFEANGYRTGYFGKWHNGQHYPNNPLGQGFETFFGFCGGHWSRYFDPVLQHNEDLIQTKGYISDLFTDSAIAFMTDPSDTEQPFFAYLSYNTPHTPFIAPHDLYQSYIDQGLSEELASTYAMVKNIDDNIGKIMTSFKNKGLLDNTLIIFITDNGPNYDRFNAGMRGRKGYVSDGGVRVPSFWYWPSKLDGSKTITELTAHIDLYPTLEDLLDLAPIQHKPIDGISFSSLLLGQEAHLPDRNFYTFSTNLNQHKGAVRNRNFRLTIEDSLTCRLTDINMDPSESVLLNQEYPEVLDSLKKQYYDMYQEVTSELSLPREIPLGHPGAKTTTLAAHEAHLTGELSYGTVHWGWCHDWISNWSSPLDTIIWQVDVLSPVDYSLEIAYACPEEALGSRIIISSDQHQLEWTVEEAYEKKLIPSQEQVRREVEAEDYSWKKIKLGRIHLEAGRQQILLFYNRNNGSQFVEIKDIMLTRES